MPSDRELRLCEVCLRDATRQVNTKARGIGWFCDKHGSGSAVKLRECGVGGCGRIGHWEPDVNGDVECGFHQTFAQQPYTDEQAEELAANMESLSRTCDDGEEMIVSQEDFDRMEREVIQDEQQTRRCPSCESPEVRAIIERLCALQELVASSAPGCDYAEYAADCFCGEGGNWHESWHRAEDFRNDLKTIEFIENAVKDALRLQGAK